MNKIQVQTELMKNQKAAQVLPPQSKFKALQTNLGLSLFFSIGSDDQFYLTLEQMTSTTGWSPINLSGQLAALHVGETLSAKNFAVGQDIGTGDISIALAVRSKEKKTDYLYTMSKLSYNQNASWYAQSKARPWTLRSYDDTKLPIKQLNVAFLEIELIFASKNYPMLIVGLKSESTAFIQKYTVSLDSALKTDVWKPIPTAENYDKLFSLTIGKSSSSDITGIYELFSLNKETGLLYSPVQGKFGPPSVTKLQAPKGATSLATLPTDNENHTDLFVAGQGAIYLFPANKQTNNAAGIKIIENNIFSAVTDLNAHIYKDQIVLWGLNQIGQVFYTSCLKKDLTDVASWSFPVGIVEKSMQISSIINQQNGANEIFAHVPDNQLVKLSQDVETTIWHQRSITIPPLKLDDVYEYYSFTTHIQVTDASNLPVTANLKLSSLANVGVFIDDQYVNLSSENIPIQTASDGIVTVIQETQSLSAITYTLEEEKSETIAINPMTAMIKTVGGKVQNSSDLLTVHITNEKGKTQRLVPKNTSSNNVNAVAQISNQLVTASKKLPSNGSSIKAAPINQEMLVGWKPNSENLVAATCDGSGDLTLSRGIDAAKALGMTIHQNGIISIQNDQGSLDSVSNAICIAAGDFVRWFKHLVDDICNWWIKTVKEVDHFFIQIGKDVFYFTIQAISDVAHGIEFVFNKIKVGLEKLVQWLGFIFEWEDIVRTHDVFKSIINNYLNYAVDQLPKTKTEIQNFFIGLEEWVDTWSGITSIPNTTSGESAKKKNNHNNSPQANWGVHHTKSGVKQSNPGIGANPNFNDEVKKTIQDLLSALEKEKTIFEDAVQKIKKEIIDQINDLSITEIVKKLAGIILDVLIESAENIICSLIDILIVLVKDVVKLLNKPMNIPVISWLYNKIVPGSQLSIMDLSCLVAAIPATIGYKLITRKTPFPDDKFTKSVKHAKDFKTIQALYRNNNTLDELPAETGNSADKSSALIASLELGSAIASFVFIFCIDAKADDPTNKPISVATGIFFFLTTGPNIGAAVLYNPKIDDYKVWSLTMYGLSACQKMLDVFSYREDFEDYNTTSRGVDTLLGVCSMVPTVQSIISSQSTRSIVNFFTSTSWNMNRILTILAKNPEVFAAKVTLIGIYGVLEILLGVIDAEGKKALN